MSSSAASSSSASPSPEPEIMPKSKGKKGKGKARRDGAGKDESSHDPHWAFKPPPGMAAVDDVVHGGEFDWEAVKDADDGTEIWIIRVPESIKPKYLEGLTIELPSSTEKTDRVGVLKRKHHDYDVWSLGDGKDDETPVGGEELKNISCLLPRKSKKGSLQLAPKPVTRHLVLSAQNPTPQPADNVSVVHQNPPRPSYPKEVLKHQFIPCGSLAPKEDDEEEEEEHADVQEKRSEKMTVVDDEVPAPSSQKKVSKKRKGGAVGEEEEGPPKKAKKAKTLKK